MSLKLAVRTLDDDVRHVAIVECFLQILLDGASRVVGPGIGVDEELVFDVGIDELVVVAFRGIIDEDNLNFLILLQAMKHRSDVRVIHNNVQRLVSKAE